jgi:hypothetical protein
VEKVGKRLAVNKQRLQRFNMERFNLKKLIEVEDKEDKGRYKKQLNIYT